MDDLDILIVNYRTPQLTQDAAARLGSAGRVRIWDNSGDLAGGLSGAELLACGENIMYAAASNRLYTTCSAPYVLLLNADALATPSDVAKLRHALDARPDAWGAAPRLVDLHGLDQHYRRRLPTVTALLADRVAPLRAVFRTSYRRMYCRDVKPDMMGYVEQPAAACLLLRRKCVGPLLFDETFPLFGNDLDLAKRMKDRGYPCVYVPGVIVRHVGGASISVARERDAARVREAYDMALRTYARRYLAGSALLEPIFALRLLLHRLTRVFRRRTRI